jgi:hypothetical protein
VPRSRSRRHFLQGVQLLIGGASEGARAPGAHQRCASLVLVTLTLKARVQGGRVVVEDSVDLPDDTELQLLVVDEGDDLDDEERARFGRSRGIAAAGRPR